MHSSKGEPELKLEEGKNTKAHSEETRIDNLHAYIVKTRWN